VNVECFLVSREKKKKTMMTMSTTVCVSAATLLALLGAACARGEPPKKVVIGGLFPYTLEGEEFGCKNNATLTSHLPTDNNSQKKKTVLLLIEKNIFFLFCFVCIFLFAFHITNCSLYLLISITQYKKLFFFLSFP
jgi:hypothetical protein